MTFHADNTLITNREMLRELAKVAGLALLRAPVTLAIILRRRMTRH